MIYVDPGVKACGVACFEEAQLRWARYVPAADLPHYFDGSPLLCEFPRIYPGSGQQKGDLNDLLNVAAVVGLCEGLNGDERCARVFPSQWKGQVPKKIMTARILSKLSDVERSRIIRVGAKDHNTIDAVGIGLWHLGRLR